MKNTIIASILKRGGGFHSVNKGPGRDCLKFKEKLKAQNPFSITEAFTLAEVLITLGIIGIIAALTLPQVIVNYEKKATEVRLRKDYSTLANALKMAEAEHGPIETWAGANGENFKEYFKKMEPYIQFATEPCFEEEKCLPKQHGAYMTGIYFRLKDGTYGLFADNNVPNPVNPKFYFTLLTSEKHAIYGRTFFKFSIMNLKNLKIKANTGAAGTPIWYWDTPAECKNSNAAWNEYYCFMKFAQDGFTFKDNYNFEKLNNINNVYKSMLKTKPRGWF